LIISVYQTDSHWQAPIGKGRGVVEGEEGKVEGERWKGRGKVEGERWKGRGMGKDYELLYFSKYTPIGYISFRLFSGIKKPQFLDGA